MQAYVPPRLWKLHTRQDGVISRGVTQTVSRWCHTAEAWVRTQISACGICGGQRGTGTHFMRVLWLSPVSTIPLLFHIHSCKPILSPGVWAVGPLAAQFHRDIVTPTTRQTITYKY
jgi:hypothetical protein